MGPGSDLDSYKVYRCASDLIYEWTYDPSRLPSYFVHEAVSALLIPLGGTIATNLGTVGMALLAVGSFLHICRRKEIPHRYWLATLLAFHPIFFVNSNSTIDYVWAVALMLAATSLLIEERPVLAGLVLGLAIGVRLSSVLFVGALGLAHLLTTPREHWMRIIFPAAIAGVTGAVLYVPAFVHVGYSMDFLTYGIGDWGWQGYLGRFVYKNIYFFGLQTTVALLVIGPLALRSWRNLRAVDSTLVATSLICIVVFELLYLKIPLENAYLLPMLPFLIILIGILLRERKNVLIALVALQLSYNFVNINIARPDRPHHAEDATVGLWLESGYVIANTEKRVQLMSVWEIGSDAPGVVDEPAIDRPTDQ
jgi:NADH:ubiquinone oxidoreductase subunit K